MVENYPDWSHQQNLIKIGTHTKEVPLNLTWRISTLINSPKDLYNLLLPFFMYLLTFTMWSFIFFLQNINNIKVTPFNQNHGYSNTLGFLFHLDDFSFAYSTDLVELPEDSFKIINNVNIWIVGTLVDSPHPTHAHVDKVLSWVKRVKPKRTILTHMSVALDYDILNNRLPDGVEAAFDGMKIT